MVFDQNARILERLYYTKEPPNLDSEGHEILTDEEFSASNNSDSFTDDDA